MSKNNSAPSANHTRGCSKARPRAAGDRWRYSYITLISSAAPGSSIPIRLISGATRWSTFTKMVISNGERQHPGVVDGKTLSRTRPPGMLFFNDKGDECGGLSFSGDQKDGNSNAGALLAFDRFRQDQTVAIQYGESNGQYSAGRSE